jgi:uncharacterized protein
MKSLGRSAYLILCLALASCTSLSHYDQIDQAVARDDYASGLAQAKASKETSYSAKDKILYYLDVGMLAHYAGDQKESLDMLSSAERSIEEAYTKSVTQAASTYLVNDNTQDYSGEDYEDIYLNIFKTLEFAKSGDNEDAMVEIRRVDNKIKFLASKYDKAINDAKSEAQNKSKDVKYEVDTSPVKFTDSALARYLSMIFYRAGGQLDDAEIDRKQLLAAFKSEASLYAFPPPSSLKDELEVPSGQARLNVVGFSGLSPIKKENTTRVFLGNAKWIKIAVPVMYLRPSMVAKTELVFDTGKVVPLERIEDMSAVAAETFRLKASLIYIKTIIRSIVKTATSIALDKGADRAKSSDASLALSVLSLATQAYSELSEQADLRVSRYFPGRADVAGISLEPGVYSFTIRYLDASGRIIQQTRFANYTVKKKGVNLVEGVCIK